MIGLENNVHATITHCAMKNVVDDCSQHGVEAKCLCWDSDANIWQHPSHKYILSGHEIDFGFPQTQSRLGV